LEKAKKNLLITVTQVEMRRSIGTKKAATVVTLLRT